MADANDRAFHPPKSDKKQQPPAIRRHLLLIKEAIEAGDPEEVANRQLRLLKGHFDFPTTLKEAQIQLEKLSDT